MLRRLAARLAPRRRTAYFGGDGPRGYVGGLWHEMGELQFRFLVDQGLRPGHVLLDIACGSLRGGVRLIPYLDAGHYHGLDISAEMIAHGREVELGAVLEAVKRPELVVSDRFAFDRFSRPPDYAIAQSLFSHLTAADIALCLRQLARHRLPGTRLFATFHESAAPVANPPTSGPHTRFAYTAGEMARIGEETGWRTTYLGDWGHPRGQRMLEFTPADPAPTPVAAGSPS